MKRAKPLIGLFIVLLSSFLLSGCSEFQGLRKPLYDGQPVVPDEEAIAIYTQSGEVIGAEKESYIRYPFSSDLYQSSLEHSDTDPVLLTDGEYIVGEDLPAGRVTLLGNESSFSQENYDVHLGNLMIYDEDGEVYFENLFHTLYGPLMAQVDFLPGHRIEIIGQDSEITVFYTEEIPEDPYQLMDPPTILENLGRLSVQSPLIISDDKQLVQLTAGVYEVGVHIEPGEYELTNVDAPHHTELFLFHEGEELRVFELLLNTVNIYSAEEELPIEAEKEEGIRLQLKTGDKIYPNLVRQLELTRIK